MVAQHPGVASRERACRLIMAGRVRVDGHVVDKPGTPVAIAAVIDVETDEDSYVSRGGDKLDGGLDHFGTAVEGRVVLDIGASTGGFTDCVLRRGARRVVAVDVGYGQLDWRLRGDDRVSVMERTNARHLMADDIRERPDLVVIDVSFISLTLILPVAARLLAAGGEIVALVKPQFEVARSEVGKGGVVRDPLLHASAVAKVRRCGEELGFECLGECASPLLGPKGNREFFLAFRATNELKPEP
jgi:23S rRNA (cytidine1920-2'-O)/16S rRNA (cytidine1409-2'-O)-methyltransferase